MQILSTFKQGQLTLRLVGELDHHAAKLAMNAIGREIDLNLPTQCLVDCASLGFMDSSGIAVVLNVHKRMVELSGEAIILNVPQQAMKVLNAAGIERIVHIKEPALQGGV